MYPLTFSIFPEFKENYSYYAIQKNLELVESVVHFSRGQFMGPEKIELIKEKLGKKLKGTRLYPGGSSVLFGWSFPSEQVGRLMYKPYYTRHLTQLLIHYFCIGEFLTSLKEIEHTYYHHEQESKETWNLFTQNRIHRLGTKGIWLIIFQQFCE